MTSYQISDCSIRLNQGLLPAKSANFISGYMGIWHVTQKLIMFLGLSLKAITLEKVEKAKEASTKFVVGANRCFLLGVS